MIYQFELTYNSQTIIADEPIGWSDVKFIKRRDTEFEGVFFEFSSELTFYNEAYNFIKNAYDTDDLAADVDVVIKQKRVEWKAFSTFFSGKVLFENLKYNNTQITVILEKNDVLRQLKNNIDKTVEITTNKTVTLHSLPIVYASKFNTTTTTFNKAKGGSHTPPVIIANNELDTTIIPEDEVGKQAFFYNGNQQNRSIRVTGTIDVQCKEQTTNLDAGVTLIISHQEVGGTYDNSNDVTIYDTKTTNTNHTHTITIDQTVDVPFNHNIFIFLEDKSNINLFDPVTWNYADNTNDITLTETTTEPISTSKGVTFHEAFTQVCSDIGVSYTSTFLQESNQLHVLLTNGYNLRRQDQKIKTTFKQLFNIVKILFRSGLKVNSNQVEIVAYDDIYDTSTLQIITNHSEVDEEVKKDLAVSKIEVAYEQYKIRDTATSNFEFEFNTKREFELQTIRTPRKAPIKVPVIAAGIVIETIRRRNLSTSNSYPEDDKLVVISLNRSTVSDSVIYGTSSTFAAGTVAERNEALTVSSYEHLTRIYNARFSPRRIAKNVLNKYYFSDKLVYNFTTGEANNNILIENESESGNIGTQTFKLVTPMSVKFVTNEAITSDYLQVSNIQLFINEVEETLKGSSSVIGVKKVSRF